jgi:hypothetical protein
MPEKERSSTDVQVGARKVVEFSIASGGMGFTIIAMHLPDPSYVSFVTAVISSVTATIGLVRLLLEKKILLRTIRTIAVF